MTTERAPTECNETKTNETKTNETKTNATKTNETMTTNESSSSSSDEEDEVVVTTVVEDATTTATAMPPSAPLDGRGLDASCPPFLFCGECTGCAPPPPPLTTTGQRRRRRRRRTDDDDDDDEGEVELVVPLSSSSPPLGSFTAASSSKRLVASTFRVPGLSSSSSSSSERSALWSVLLPAAGVESCAVVGNDALEVRHDPFVAPAASIARRLTHAAGRVGAAVVRDGGASTADVAAPSGVCRSTARVLSGLCCASEVPTLRRTLERLDGVRGEVRVNVAARTVYVDHDPFVVDLRELCAALTEEGFRAVPKRDGARAWRRPTLPVANTDTNTDTVNDDDDDEDDYVETTLRVGRLSSLAHVKGIERALKKTNSASRKRTGRRRAVRAFHPHPPSSTVRVEHASTVVTATDLARALTKDAAVGDVTVVEDGEAAGRRVRDPKANEFLSAAAAAAAGEEEENLYGDLAEDRAPKLNVVLSGVFWVLSMTSVFGGKWTYLQYCGLLSAAFGLPPVARKAFRTIRRCRLDANCMMLIAAIGALLLGEYDEAASVSFLFAVSEWLEARATYRAREALSRVCDARPERANVVDEVTGRVIVGVPADAVRVGTSCVVRAGDRVPCDGVVTDGATEMDESDLTGEADPVSVEPGDEVDGGTVNAGNSRITIRTTAAADDSAVSRLVRLVEEAQAHRGPAERLVDSFAKIYTPAVLLLALAMSTISWFFGVDEGRRWTYHGLIIVVVACPCALTISTPVTYAAGLASTASKGVVVKGGAHLEALGRVGRVVFDKTGTLTEGRFVLTGLVSFQSKGEHHHDHERHLNELLELLVVMEAPSSHPLASTVLQAAESRHVTVPPNTVLEDHAVLHGEGVAGTVNGVRAHVGNRRLFERLGLYPHKLSAAHKRLVDDWSDSGGTIGLVGRGDEVIGAFRVEDAPRREAKRVVERLRERGVRVDVLTGDGEGAARRVGDALGLRENEIQSRLRPDDKLHAVGAMLRGGDSSSSSSRCCGRRRPNDLVLFCGDGVNDAPALAAADVGVAMGDGAALAMEMSNVTLVDSNLEKLLFSMDVGERVVRTVRENILVSLSAKLAVVGLTFAGRMTLFSAIAADVGVMLAVTLNGMKLLPSAAGREKEDPVVNDDVTRTRRTTRMRRSRRTKSNRGGYAGVDDEDETKEAEAMVDINIV